MVNHLIFLALGLLFLIWGAEWLVRGASKLARMLGVSPLAIGLTIVAYGTSTPELVVNISSAISGKPDIALGNVVGSNIFNILFILGSCALIAPLKVEAKFVRWDVPIMILTSAVLLLFCLDHKLSHAEGWLMIAGVGVYTWFCFAYSKKESEKVLEEFEKEYGNGRMIAKSAANFLKFSALIVAGLTLLVLGSQWLVDSSVAIARLMGLSELVIALTIVAAGTSLPEVATSILATIKGERDIAIGNVIGSNIYNVLAIMGITSTVTGRALPINPNSLTLDIPFMVFVSLICYPIFRSKHAISRAEGAMFLVLYVVYTAYLIGSSH